jgi:hypothetical protein
MEKEGPHALEMGKEEKAQAQKENAEKGRRALGLSLPILLFLMGIARN